MEYNSFYGGRQGAPFIISGSFATVAEMWAAFSQGDNYKTINYDEYVIIDAVNKNDKDNGKVYQRGRDYQKVEVIDSISVHTGDAQYVGQIVGPAGPTPLTELISIEDVVDKAEEESQATDGRDWRLSKGLFAKTRYICMNDDCTYYTTYKCRYMTTIQTSTCPECHQNHMELVEIPNLVPGAKTNSSTGMREFDDTTDAIQYALVSVRDKDGHEAYIYVGFTFPYTVIDYTTVAVAPYYNHNYTDTSKAERIDDENHPYYEKWRISIPKGVKGDSLRDFAIMADAGASANPRWVDPAASGNQNKPKHLVYKLYNYDLVDNPSPEYIDLGAYHMIRSITLDTSTTASTSGTITIAYEDNTTSTTFSKALTWIRSISLNPDTGLFTITYNNNKINNSTTYTANLKWVKGLSVNEYGVVTISYTYNNGQATDVDLPNKIKYIDHITLNDSNNGKLKIYYNTRTNNVQDVDELDLVWAASINLDNDGTMTYVDSKGVSHSLGTIRWIVDSKVLTQTDITTDPTHFANNEVGDFVIKFNDSDQYVTLTNIKMITNIQGNSGYIQIDYNNGDPSTYIVTGTTNSTGAILAEDTGNPATNPEPIFAEGSPWFIVEEIGS